MKYAIFDKIHLVDRLLTKEQIEDVLRVINTEIRTNGLDPKVMDDWYSSNCPFPHLRQHPAIMKIARLIPPKIGLTDQSVGELCEPQIIWHWPDPESKPKQWSHVDAVPGWATGRHYRLVAGVALSDWLYDNGTLRCWLEDDTSNNPDLSIPVELWAGDAILLRPDVPHTASVNTSGHVRAGIYFRWLSS